MSISTSFQTVLDLQVLLKILEQLFNVIGVITVASQQHSDVCLFSHLQGIPKDTFLSDYSRGSVECLCTFIYILFNLFVYLLYIYSASIICVIILIFKKIILIVYICY